MRTHRKFSPKFKAKVALAAVRGEESVAEIAKRHKIHVNLVYKWKDQLLENMSRAFETGSGADASEREAELLKKIGELTVERDFLSKGLDRSR
jgi:transposase-like protein